MASNTKRLSLNLDIAKLPANTFKYIQPTSYAQQGTLNIPGICQDLAFKSEDLIDQGEIGRGAYGFVNKMILRETNYVMAVKRIRSTLDEAQQRSALKELDVVVNSSPCPSIIRFYGALFCEGDCWICMELMEFSLDKLYRFVYRHLNETIPEPIIGKVTCATVKALDYLKTNLDVIHRDVKPSNILIDKAGNIKLCDFGISGKLVDSIAKTRDAGCKPYMAPERIHPQLAANGYDIRSDVWSLGITLVELATGSFPYPAWTSVFDQLTCVLYGDPPRLPEGVFSPEFVQFVDKCLNKEPRVRPKYDQLQKLAFFQYSLTADVDVGSYFSSIIDRVPSGLNLTDFLTKEST